MPTNAQLTVPGTANIVAVYRARAKTIPYARRMLSYLPMQTAERLLNSRPPQANRLLTKYFELRFHSLSATLEKQGIKNVFEIAAGHSPRGLIYSRQPGVRYCVTDDQQFEDLEKIGKIILSSERNDPERQGSLSFARVNALKRDEFIEAFLTFKSQCAPDEPIAIIQEGLFRYLHPEKKMQVGTTIRELCADPRVRWITNDLPLADVHNQFCHLTGDTSLRGATGTFEGVDLFYFVNAADALFFFTYHGFTVEREKQLKLVPHFADEFKLDEFDYLDSREIWTMRAAPASLERCA